MNMKQLPASYRMISLVIVTPRVVQERRDLFNRHVGFKAEPDAARRPGCGALRRCGVKADRQAGLAMLLQ